jgi:hypothetical protein
VERQNEEEDNEEVLSGRGGSSNAERKSIKTLKKFFGGLVKLLSVLVCEALCISLLKLYAVLPSGSLTL